jgi:hypothetical protein
VADLDDVAIGVAHVATPFPAIPIGQRLSDEDGSFGAPLMVTDPDVGHAQAQKTVHSVQIRRRLENDLELVGPGPPPELRLNRHARKQRRKG